jgi:hypothetical protein
LLLSNELPEVQHTNQVALWTIDHDPQYTPLIDKNGQVRWLVAPETPQAAVGFDGQSVLPQIAESGDIWQWKGAAQPANDKATDGIILTFSKPVHAERARLVVRARNAPWLQFVYGNFRDALGVYEPFVDRQYRQKSRSSLLRWMQDQDMPLSVSIEKSPGKWVTLDYFNMPGASAFREDVMEIDVSSVKTGQLKLKLEHGFRFWEIDWVALDYAPSGSGQLTVLKPVSAIDKAQHDHAPALVATDQWYLHQPFVGDQSRLVFDAAPVPAGQKRSFFLQATGYYDLKRTPTTQKPGVFALQQFKKRHALSHLSHQLWREYGSMLAH